MADPFQSALESLYRAPLTDFVAERKRLAGELKSSGDAATSKRVAALGRPSVSAWAVNQLWWHERPSFEALLEAAARLRSGDRDAGKVHKAALAKLREQAAALLQGAGNAAAEATLRRVTTTLSALAVAGGFEPDPPGALVADRDPPGFEALGFGSAPVGSAPVSSAPVGSAPVSSAPVSSAPVAAEANAADVARARAEEAERRRAEEAERRRAEEAERARRLAERERLSTTLREAQHLSSTQQRELARVRSELETAERALQETQTLIAEIEGRLASL